MFTSVRKFLPDSAIGLTSGIIRGLCGGTTLRNPIWTSLGTILGFMVFQACHLANWHLYSLSTNYTVSSLSKEGIISGLVRDSLFGTRIPATALGLG